ncbi:uncharacterized protein [Haliotis asinina]|uniref:uncharacterized protein n=1 Tax=Haliotis asinina TaxID=109174 RepID=UPI003531B018
MSIAFCITQIVSRAVLLVENPDTLLICAKGLGETFESIIFQDDLGMVRVVPWMDLGVKATDMTETIVKIGVYLIFHKKLKNSSPLQPDRSIIGYLATFQMKSILTFVESKYHAKELDVLHVQEIVAAVSTSISTVVGDKGTAERVLSVENRCSHVVCFLSGRRVYGRSLGQDLNVPSQNQVSALLRCWSHRNTGFRRRRPQFATSGDASSDVRPNQDEQDDVEQISVVCIEEFEWKRDYELDDRTVTSHVLSCHDVTTVTECLKDCSSLKLCHSVFVYKPNMSCCLNKMGVYTTSTTRAAPGHVHYMSLYVAGNKATISSAAAKSETTTEDIITSTELTSTTDTITTEVTTATVSTTTPTVTIALATTASTTTTEATASVLNDGFINVPSIHLTFRTSSTGLSWSDARTVCGENNGHLIYLNTAAKRSHIIAHLSGLGISDEFYIGAIMQNGITPFWMDGTRIVNPPWASNEPHNNAKCVLLIIPSGRWKDDDCSLVRQYICEQ